MREVAKRMWGLGTVVGLKKSGSIQIFHFSWKCCIEYQPLRTRTQEDFCSLHQVQDSASLSRSHLGLLWTFEGGLFFLSPPGIGFLKGQWSFGARLTPSDRLRISHNNNDNY
ncbi:hypothetical protein TNCV_4648811 [Trichonephila clavipes]|uniref:Uncharacterized protein n=1 Tax=Trichonephila clavipes TaxID=2585209 RepID=A0A8X6STH1_TRICX|nr:hypothetical protein TNCV_4648811 [Trichonephila clavipes]